jgi:hypothetical protein
MEKNKLDKIIEAFRHHRYLKEEGIIANNVSGGNIAGTPQADPGNPPVFPKRKKRIYLGLLSRKKWLDYLKNK